MDPTAILSGFVDAGQTYQALTMPYAKHLWLGLVTLEVIIIALSHIMDAEETGAIIWRLVRLGFLAGFAFWWIDNAWTLGMTVLGSFNMLGSQISGVGSLNPAGFVAVATRMCEMLWHAPSSDRLLPNVALALGEITVAIIIMLVFLTIAGLAMFTVAAALVILGPGSLIVAFLPSRFFTELAQGYFTWLIRTGVVILFFYVVLGVSQTLVSQWNTNVANACAATVTSLPAPVLGAPSAMITATPCTQPIPLTMLLTLLADTVILGFIAIGIPFTAASIVSHGVNMALEHLASATYMARTITRPLVSGMQHTGRSIGRQLSGPTPFQQRMKAGAAAAANTRPTPPRPSGPNQFGVRPTTPLSNGKSVTSNVTRKL